MTEQVQENQEQPEQTQAPELNINDLAAMRSLIEVVTQRGAFRANELSGVGQLFDKLNAFLDAVAKAQPQPEQTEAPQGE